MKKITTLTAVSLICITLLAQKTPKPPMMGFSTWNSFHALIDENLIKAQADALVSTGLRDAGYVYLNIDDGYFDGRDADGNIKVKADKFPGGMKALADYVHSKGLKFGLYGDAGPNTCASIWENPKETGGIGVGFYNHEDQDMQLYFNTWDADYVKVDYCGASQQTLKLDEQTQYTKIKNAIDKTGVTDYIYNVCRWTFPGTWVSNVADSWRISGDIRPNFGSMTEILDLNTFLAPFMSPGHYNDMDMLEIGNGMTRDENIAQMSLWCVLTSPLVQGADLRTISAETLKIVTNPEAIAVNQDMTEQGHLISDFRDPLQIWSKKINGKQSGERAVVLFNRTGAAANITVNFADIDLGPNVTIRNLWAAKDLGAFIGSYTVNAPLHGAVMLIIKGTNVNPTTYEAEYAYLHNFNHLVNTNPIPNQARATEIEGASKRAGVTFIGGNADNYLEFRDIFVEENGQYPLTISYLCGEDRTARMSVNGVVVPSAVFNSGSSRTIATQSLYINLKAGSNVIRFENSTASVPDLDKIYIGKKDGTLPATTVTLEAEYATLSSDLQVTENANASAGKTVIGLGAVERSEISFPPFVFINKSGIYPLQLTYFSAEKKNIKININGKIYSLTDLQSASGTTSNTTTVLVELIQGENTIKLYSDALSAEIDKIYVDMTRAYTNIVNMEAENATLIKNTQAQPRLMIKAGASGGKTVGWLGQSSTYKMVYSNVSVKKAGNYKLSVWYFSGENRNITVKVNGVNYQLNNLNSGSWDKAAPATINDVPMNLTGNTIEIYNATGWAPDIDFVELDGSALLLNDIIGTSTKKTKVRTLFVRPNPTKGELTVSLENDEKVELYDLIGTKIKDWNLKSEDNIIYISELESGIYILRTQDKSVKVLKN